MTDHYPPDPLPAGADAGLPIDPDADTGGFPWPPPQGESVISAWGRTWQGSALQPRRFFAAMPRTVPLGSAVIYYLSIGIPVAGAALFWSMIRSAAGMEQDAGPLGGATAVTPLIEFLLSPVLLLLSLFLAAGVTHVMLKIFGGANGDYGLTTRVFAFSYSPQLLGVIPFIGTAVGFVWMLIVSIVGLREAHHTSTGRAAAAVLIPAAILLMFGVFVALMVTAGGLLELPV